MNNPAEKRAFIDRNLRPRALAPRVIPRAKEPPEKKNKDTSNVPIVSFCPFRPVLCPFCPVLCPPCPSNKRLKFVENGFISAEILNC